MSVSGREGSSDLPWMVSGAITATLESVGGALQLTVVTPCGPLSGPVTRAGSVFTAGSMAVGASGCLPPRQAGQQPWLLAFLKKPFDVMYSNGRLTWTNGLGSLVFEPR